MGGRNGGWTVRPETPYETAKVRELLGVSNETVMGLDNAIEPCAQVLQAPSQQFPPQP
jgi:hypothetical protein